MVAIRSVTVRHFRGFETFRTVVRDHAVLVGEPGSGRSDFVEALVRVLDPDSLRARTAVELDFFDLDVSQPAEIEVAIGGFGAAGLGALTNYGEVWDRATETVLAALPHGTPFDADLHELVVRLGYRLEDDSGDLVETVHWPKYFNAATGMMRRASATERRLIPFYWQRGSAGRGLDLSQRGEFFELAERQTVGDLQVALSAFVAEIEAAARTLSATDPFAAALTEVLAGLRDVRRFDPVTPAANLIAFLPDGGSRSGILRTLHPALTLADAPPLLPAGRHGGTALAALRYGLLRAVALSTTGAIVVVDDIGGEFDPHLGRHLATEIRARAGQLIAGTRSEHVVEAFAPQEVLRFRGRGAGRTATSIRIRSKADQIAARHMLSSLSHTLSASSVVLVEGIHDRQALTAVADRARDQGLLASFDGAGIAFASAPSGDGSLKSLAMAARRLGLFTVVLLDNDRGDPATTNQIVQGCLPEADVVVRLPARMAIEEAILVDIPDAELLRAWTEIETALGLTLPAGWNAQTGAALVQVLSQVLHGPTGTLHASFVWELTPANLPPVALKVLGELLRITTTPGTSGLVELTWP